MYNKAWNSFTFGWEWEVYNTWKDVNWIVVENNGWWNFEFKFANQSSDIQIDNSDQFKRIEKGDLPNIVNVFTNDDLSKLKNNLFKNDQMSEKCLKKLLNKLFFDYQKILKLMILMIVF